MESVDGKENKCATCGSSESTNALKVCAKCKTVRHCSRDCQKNDWKAYKKVCGAGEEKKGTKPPKRFVIDKPLHALQTGTWLRDRPEEDVHQLIRDVYRLRREDEYKFKADVMLDSIHDGGDLSDELKHSRRFLNNIIKLDTARPEGKKLLPEWWSKDSSKKCVEVATVHKDASIQYAVEKHDIQQFYDMPEMPMQLRTLGEALDGSLVNGQNG